jgi:hypothetical protein
MSVCWNRKEQNLFAGYTNFTGPHTASLFPITNKKNHTDIQTSQIQRHYEYMQVNKIIFNFNVVNLGKIQLTISLSFFSGDVMRFL